MKTMSWANIDRSWKRLYLRRAEDVISAIQGFLWHKTDPKIIKQRTGLPLHLIDKIRTEHYAVQTDVAEWLEKRDRKER